jgi:ribonuclease HI
LAQLNADDKIVTQDMKAIIHSDGGSRGNPGPAAIGVVIELPHKKIEIGEKIGIATNNVAEYRAIIRGLEEAQKNNVTEVECYLDSELVVKQIKGEYRIKDPKMIELASKVFALRDTFDFIVFISIPREKNKAADKLVNMALDTK